MCQCKASNGELVYGVAGMVSPGKERSVHVRYVLAGKVVLGNARSVMYWQVEKRLNHGTAGKVCYVRFRSCAEWPDMAGWVSWVLLCKGKEWHVVAGPAR